MRLFSGSKNIIKGVLNRFFQFGVFKQSPVKIAVGKNAARNVAFCKIPFRNAASDSALAHFKKRGNVELTVIKIYFKQKWICSYLNLKA